MLASSAAASGSNGDQLFVFGWPPVAHEETFLVLVAPMDAQAFVHGCRDAQDPDAAAGLRGDETDGRFVEIDVEPGQRGDLAGPGAGVEHHLEPRLETLTARSGEEIGSFLPSEGPRVA